ncbi:hypothetical protein [Streptomyces sp. NPDC057363]|uniref:hypothetical protein n=1 Tax=Streptomyces sp. NPDC057363 TaxID=3346107 RepID=UPI00363A9D8C
MGGVFGPRPYSCRGGAVRRPGHIAAAFSLGIPVEESKRHHDGTVTSDHGAQAAVFLPADDMAHVAHTAGTTSDDYAHDLPLLVKSTR